MSAHPDDERIIEEYLSRPPLTMQAHADWLRATLATIRAENERELEEARESIEEVIEAVERVRLDVDVIVCGCGEAYKNSDLDLSVGDLKRAIAPFVPSPDKVASINNYSN